ncbi:MAG: peptidoglycan editing factor PgeF [Desulfobulbaceae bacterium]|nr:MAG: peptidoglycan editing factor PgeF [Desulfobulbaceae bacterium]
MEKDILFGSFGPEHNPACRYAMFNRHGGLSRPPFSYLNCSYAVGDDRKAVAANRSAMKEIIKVDRLVSVGQVHGDGIHCLEDFPADDLEIAGYDAIVSPLPDVGLMIQHADCQAVLLCDPVRRIIAAVHSGWRGSVGDILGKTVRLMADRYTARPQDMMAVIGPSLGPCCSEFVNHRLELPDQFQRFRTMDNHFDFWQISREQLTAAGLLPSSISVAGVCTSCSLDYFSYRRAKREGNGVTGRNGSVIVLGKATA